MVEPFIITPWKSAALFAFLGIILCFNPLLDIISGPLEVKGTVRSARVWHGRLWRKYGYTTTTHGEVIFDSVYGKEIKIKTAEIQVNRWMDYFVECQSEKREIRSIILRRLNLVLSV